MSGSGLRRSHRPSRQELVPVGRACDRPPSASHGHSCSGMLSRALLPALVEGPFDGENRPSVLVVDRDPDRRLFLRTSLRGRCRVVTAASWEEGTAHLHHCPPRVLIVGSVSGGTEREACGTATLCGPEVPAVLRLWVARPAPEWADATLRHPFTPAELIGTIEPLLRNDGTADNDGLAEADAVSGASPSRD